MARRRRNTMSQEEVVDRLVFMVSRGADNRSLAEQALELVFALYPDDTKVQDEILYAVTYRVYALFWEAYRAEQQRPTKETKRKRIDAQLAAGGWFLTLEDYSFRLKMIAMDADHEAKLDTLFE